MTRLAALIAQDSRAAPLAAAVVTLIAGLIAPPLALLCIAAAAAWALMQPHTNTPRVDWPALAAPLLGAAIVGAAAGFDAAMGLLFIWRVAADARWSARQAARLADLSGAPGLSKRDRLVLAGTPLFGLTMAAYTAPHMLAGLPLDLPHIPILAPIAIGAAALLIVFDWALQRLADARLGLLARAPALHIATHQAVFLAAYVLSPDLSAGFMAVIVWRIACSARQASFTAVP